ncbi:MAG: hypothetical protein JO081_17385, partial [Alphaproteobacteria bacterium]|nr:hypothetical protein [Alphaproteobacteria bacterium]
MTGRPSGFEFLPLAIVGILGAVGQCLHVRAFAIGGLIAVAAIDYRLIFAGVARSVIFADPRPLPAVGGCRHRRLEALVAYREAHLSRLHRETLA